MENPIGHLRHIGHPFFGSVDSVEHRYTGKKSKEFKHWRLFERLCRPIGKT